MLVKDFIAQNKDILIAPLTEQEFFNLTDGNAIFVITATNGKKDIMERVIRGAGYALTVSSFTNQGMKSEICTIGLTNSGYAKIDTINLDDIQLHGNKIAFKCHPLPANDPRANFHFLR